MTISNYETQALFAEAIFRADIGHAISDEQIAYIKGLPMVRNQVNLISENLYLFEEPEMESIRDAVQEVLDLYASEVMGITQQLYVTQSWTLVNESDVGMHGHSHSNSIISGSLYFCDLPSPVARMVFDRHKTYQQIEFVPDPETRDAIVQILGETERIRAIVQSLVGFSHGGSAVAQKRASIRLRDCIDEAARLVRLSHAGKRVIIENQCPADLTMLGDQPRLVQVFLNLLSNACDASTPGDKIHVNAGKTNQTVDVEIVDQGSGIANAVLDQVFEPFVTTKAPGQGTGLGLAMVYSIVQDHGGNVQVAETSSRGTRIVVELPTGAEDLIPPHFGQGAV